MLIAAEAIGPSLASVVAKIPTENYSSIYVRQIVIICQNFIGALPTSACPRPPPHYRYPMPGVVALTWPIYKINRKKT
jgi:hypothetical protein